LQNGGPSQFIKSVSQFLGFPRVGDIGEGIIVLNEIDFSLKHLPGKPFMTVDVGLGGKREPGLNPKMAKPQCFVLKVKVQDPLGSVGKFQDRPIIAINQLHGAAGFHHTKDRDKVRLGIGGPFQEKVPDQLFLAMWTLEVQVRNTIFFSHTFGMVNQPLGLFFNERKEIHPTHAKPVINKVVKLPVRPNRVVPFKNNPIKTAKCAYNILRESFQKAVHGVLLQWLCGNYHLTAKRLFC
jgi:hypothetical protein